MNSHIEQLVTILHNRFIEIELLGKSHEMVVDYGVRPRPSLYVSVFAYELPNRFFRHPRFFLFDNHLTATAQRDALAEFLGSYKYDRLGLAKAVATVNDFCDWAEKMVMLSIKRREHVLQKSTRLQQGERTVQFAKLAGM